MFDSGPYREAELTNRLVLTILNLKVAKLAGQASEAMILATEAAGAAEGEVSVKLVCVPDGAAIGDKVFLDGGAGRIMPTHIIRHPHITHILYHCSPRRPTHSAAVLAT